MTFEDLAQNPAFVSTDSVPAGTIDVTPVTEITPAVEAPAPVAAVETSTVVASTDNSTGKVLNVDLRKIKHKQMKNMRALMKKYNNDAAAAEEGDFYAEIICTLDPTWKESDVDELSEAEVLTTVSDFFKAYASYQQGLVPNV